MANMINITKSKQGKRIADGARSCRFVVMLTEGERQEINDYRHSNRIGSRGEAMRRLIKVGLANEVAAAGSGFADTNPAAARNTSDQEITDASST